MEFLWDNQSETVYRYFWLRLWATGWWPPGALQVWEAAAGVHLCREGESHGVGGDHGGGHGEHARVLTTGLIFCYYMDLKFQGAIAPSFLMSCFAWLVWITVTQDDCCSVFIVAKYVPCLRQRIRLTLCDQGASHGASVQAPVRPLTLGLARHERWHLQWFIITFTAVRSPVIHLLTCLRAATCDRCLFTTVVIFSDVLSSHDSLSSFAVIASSITLQSPETDNSK